MTRLFLKEQNGYDRVICRTIDQIDRRIVSRFFYDDKKPTFNDEIRKRLIEIYSKDIADLEFMFDVNLSHWTKN
jgi:phosphopantetheine adenylyltransferase